MCGGSSPASCQRVKFQMPRALGQQRGRSRDEQHAPVLCCARNGAITSVRSVSSSPSAECARSTCCPAAVSAAARSSAARRERSASAPATASSRLPRGYRCRNSPAMSLQTSVMSPGYVRGGPSAPGSADAPSPRSRRWMRTRSGARRGVSVLVDQVLGVGAEGEERGELLLQRDLAEDLRRVVEAVAGAARRLRRAPRAIRPSTYSAVIGVPSSVVRSWWIHCHTCERLISAVAASSIRLSMATAPRPRNQASR